MPSMTPRSITQARRRRPWRRRGRTIIAVVQLVDAVLVAHQRGRSRRAPRRCAPGSSGLRDVAAARRAPSPPSASATATAERRRAARAPRATCPVTSSTTLRAPGASRRRRPARRARSSGSVITAGDSCRWCCACVVGAAGAEERQAQEAAHVERGQAGGHVADRRRARGCGVRAGEGAPEDLVLAEEAGERRHAGDRERRRRPWWRR